MKKFIVLLLIGIFGINILCGCSIGFEFYEYGDFCFLKMNEKANYVEGLSEHGKEKEIVIVPEKIDDKEEWILSFRLGMGTSHGLWQSENLKSVYIVPQVCFRRAYPFGTSCPNLEKVVFINAEGWEYPEYTELEYEGFNWSYKVYFNRICWSEDIKYKYANMANTSYMYNYEGSRNEGYYWVDNFEYGTKIGYIPENPEREGYVFGGWFKETECENIWDFEKDTLPDAEIDEGGEEIYQETKLYAKWYKK